MQAHAHGQTTERTSNIKQTLKTKEQQGYATTANSQDTYPDIVLSRHGMVHRGAPSFVGI